MTDRVFRTFALAGVSLWIAGIVLVLGPALAQNHGHGLRGPHPAAGEPDPYRVTRNVAGRECCHGIDCSRYNGPPPVLTRRDGKSGVLFAGQWFFADDQRIDPATLDPDVRGEPVICIGTYGTPYCFHWPLSG
jgi:hypothetical protein